MAGLVVSGEIRIDPDDFDVAMALVAPFVAMTQAESGCVAYDFWVDPRDRGRIRVFEEWESEAAQQAHADSAHLAEFYAALATIRVLSVELIRYAVSARGPL
ncbi:MAG: antibiotic biosynthesis monooxygenase [Acidimicrobiia bacterium]|nr:antibiotic biosynthesis monooxygenase [Acidimicrobiia bacterium]